MDMADCSSFWFWALRSIKKYSPICWRTKHDIDLLNKLPQDVIFDILSKLSTKDLFRLLHVSVSFKPLISHPDFLNLHIRSVADNPQLHHHLLFRQKPGSSRYYTYLCYTNSTAETCSFRSRKSFEIALPDPRIASLKSVEGSAQGVICVSSSDQTPGKSMFLWNPLIGRVNWLPDVQPSCSNPVRTVCGFGLDPVSVDFKVVKIFYYDLTSLERADAFVYAHKRKSWTRIAQMIPCSLEVAQSRDLFYNSVCVSGVVYWLARYKHPPIGDVRYNPYNPWPFNLQPAECLMGFDLTKQVFKVDKLPKTIFTRDVLHPIRLSTLVDGKSLAVFVCHILLGCYISMFAVCGGGSNMEEMHWEKKFTVKASFFALPLALVSCREFISVIRRRGMENKTTLIDVERDGEVTEDLEDSWPMFTGILPYHPSFALLDS